MFAFRELKVQDAWRVCAVQGASLRAGFPKDAKHHRVYAFLDESTLQALIRRGKAWTTKAKNCIQNMQAGRQMTASALHSLLEEAKSIKLNLTPEVRRFVQLLRFTYVFPTLWYG